MLEHGYYSQCLQPLMESIELCLAQELPVPAGNSLCFDIDGLLRMNNTQIYEANSKAITGGWLAPDEARRRVNLPPVPGGATPYLQQQNYSLAALAKRDGSDNPFGTGGSANAAPANNQAPDGGYSGKSLAQIDDFMHLLQKEIEGAFNA
jgi:phage portal protein BeeE